MIFLYFLIVFFIIIYNQLLPIIINKIKLEKEILNSNIGKKLTSVTCHNNNWFLINETPRGLKLNYYVDENNKILTCDKNFNSINKSLECGKKGEFNNRYHPCYTMISELFFYKSIN